MRSKVKSAEKYRLLQAEKALALFKGANGRPAKTLEELELWVSSPEGKAALAYDLTPDGKIIPD